MPGGCAWGPRPVNLHIEGLKKLGAQISIDRGYIIAKAKRLKANKILFNVSSVGATGNVMMAAVLAKGTTVIENAAREPEIVALTNFLVKMGAHVDSVGTTRLEIEGVDALHPADEEMIPDRIEAATFLVAAALTGGTVTIEKCNPSDLTAVIAKLVEAGSVVEISGNRIKIKGPKTLKPVDVTTSIFPGFPTDVQAQWMVLMSVAKGNSVITDTIYFDRFKHVPELLRLGADIEMNNNAAALDMLYTVTSALPSPV